MIQCNHNETSCCQICIAVIYLSAWILHLILMIHLKDSLENSWVRFFRATYFTHVKCQIGYNFWLNIFGSIHHRSYTRLTGGNLDQAARTSGISAAFDLLPCIPSAIPSAPSQFDQLCLLCLLCLLCTSCGFQLRMIKLHPHAHTPS